MKRIIVAILTIAITLGLILAVSSRASASCSPNDTECWGIQGWTGQPGWLEARWEINNNIWYIRAGAICGNGTRNTIQELSRWITVIDKWTRATCTSEYPNLNKAFYDIKHCATCTVIRTWVTIPARRKK